ncbi:MAG: hypothetical protein AAF367_16070 [Pseudomonadota bacterium]
MILPDALPPLIVPATLTAGAAILHLGLIVEQAPRAGIAGGGPLAGML